MENAYLLAGELILIGGCSIIWWFGKSTLNDVKKSIAESMELGKQCQKDVGSIRRTIDRELRPNSGESMKDQVVKLNVQMDGLIDMHKDGGNHPRTKGGA